MMDRAWWLLNVYPRISLEGIRSWSTSLSYECPWRFYCSPPGTHLCFSSVLVAWLPSAVRAPLHWLLWVSPFFFSPPILSWHCDLSFTLFPATLWPCGWMWDDAFWSSRKLIHGNEWMITTKGTAPPTVPLIPSNDEKMWDCLQWDTEMVGRVGEGRTEGKCFRTCFKLLTIEITCCPNLSEIFSKRHSWKMGLVHPVLFTTPWHTAVYFWRYAEVTL